MPIALDRLAPLDDAGRSAQRAARDARERVLHLAEHLPERDRWLVEQVYGRDVPVATLARAAAGDDPRRVAGEKRRLNRRLARLVRRVRDPLFELVATRPELLPRHTRAVARAVIVEGRSLRDAARATRRSLHQVRHHLQTVRTLARIL